MKTTPGVQAPTSPGRHGWRRLFHMASGSSIPILGIFLSAPVMVFLMAALSALAITLELLRFALPGLNSRFLRWFSPLVREAEARKVTGATYLALAALAAFLLFEKPVAVTALLFLSLGDPVAALVGGRVRGLRFFGKSLWGTLSFLVVALAVAGVLLAARVVEPHWALVVGALVAALMEFLPVPVDDNVSVPLLSGVTMALLAP